LNDSAVLAILKPFCRYRYWIILRFILFISIAANLQLQRTTKNMKKRFVHGKFRSMQRNYLRPYS